MAEPVARLIVIGEEGPDSFELADMATLGRHPESDVPIIDPRASKSHCVVERHGDSYVLRDLGSMNGTFLNGARIDGETQLEHGDEITIGAIRVTFEDPDRAGEVAASDLAFRELSALARGRAAASAPLPGIPVGKLRPQPGAGGGEAHGPEDASPTPPPRRAPVRRATGADRAAEAAGLFDDLFADLDGPTEQWSASDGPPARPAPPGPARAVEPAARPEPALKPAPASRPQDRPQEPGRAAPPSPARPFEPAPPRTFEPAAARPAAARGPERPIGRPLPELELGSPFDIGPAIEPAAPNDRAAPVRNGPPSPRFDSPRAAPAAAASALPALEDPFEPHGGAPSSTRRSSTRPYPGELPVGPRGARGGGLAGDSDRPAALAHAVVNPQRTASRPSGRGDGAPFGARSPTGGRAHPGVPTGNGVGPPGPAPAPRPPLARPAEPAPASPPSRPEAASQPRSAASPDRAFQDVVVAAVAASDVRERLERMLDAVLDLAEAERAVVFVADPEGRLGAEVVRARKGATLGAAVSMTLLQNVLRTREPTVANGAFGRVTAPTKPSVAAPILAGPRALGVLWVEGVAPASTAPDAVARLDVIAKLAGLVLATAT